VFTGHIELVYRASSKRFENRALISRTTRAVALLQRNKQQGTGRWQQQLLHGDKSTHGAAGH